MSTKQTITDFQVVDHGIDNSQYFQGCGVALTKYEHVVTGCGDHFDEAIDDALEQIAIGTSGLIDFPSLEQAIKDDLGIKTVSWPSDTVVPEDTEGTYYYVSIRYNLEGEN